MPHWVVSDTGSKPRLRFPNMNTFLSWLSLPRTTVSCLIRKTPKMRIRTQTHITQDRRVPKPILYIQDSQWRYSEQKTKQKQKAVLPIMALFPPSSNKLLPLKTYKHNFMPILVFNAHCQMASNHSLSQLCFNLFADLKHNMSIAMSNFLPLIIILWLYDRMYLFLGNTLKYLVIKEHNVFNFLQMVQK